MINNTDRFQVSSPIKVRNDLKSRQREVLIISGCWCGEGASFSTGRILPLIKVRMFGSVCVCVSLADGLQLGPGVCPADLQWFVIGEDVVAHILQRRLRI